MIESNVFVVYSKSGCPWCVKIVEVLSKINAKHVVYKLHDHFTPDDFYSEFGEGSTFPQIVVDGKHIGGCTDTIKYLQENKII